MSIEIFNKLLTEDLSLDEQVELLEKISLDHFTSADLIDCAQGILEQAIKIPLLDDYAVDLVGTGGDGLNTFNVSTTAAIIAAAAGVKIAKHGNRSVTSRCGSFDVLQALGIAVPQIVEEVERQFRSCGVTFLFYQVFHPTLKRLTLARQILAKRQVKTVFNVIGPMVNPMQVQRQAVGVFRLDLIKPYIESLKLRGMKKSLVFHGQGMDELTVTGVNHVAMLVDGEIKYFELDPVLLGLQRCELSCLEGSASVENAAITIAILNGEDHTAKRDIVLLNAAAAIMVSTDEPLIFVDAIAMARDAISSGKASALLDKLRKIDVNTH